MLIVSHNLDSAPLSGSACSLSVNQLGHVKSLYRQNINMCDGTAANVTMSYVKVILS